MPAHRGLAAAMAWWTVTPVFSEVLAAIGGVNAYFWVQNGNALGMLAALACFYAGGHIMVTRDPVIGSYVAQVLRGRS